MATTYKLADIQYIPSSVGSVLANPSGGETQIRGFLIYNGNTTSETIELHNVPDNGAGALGTASAATRFWKGTLAADDTFGFELPGPGIALTDTNDAIFAVTTTASKVTLQFQGVQNV